MLIPRIYLETTIFNFYFDKTNNLAHKSTLALFDMIADDKYLAFTSSAVIEELASAPIDKYKKMIKLVDDYKITVLTVSGEAEKLADIYVAENIIPLKYRADGVHIAIGTLNNLDLIVSMNFQHIVKLKTKRETSRINIQNGYRAIEISNPMEVI